MSLKDDFAQVPSHSDSFGLSPAEQLKAAIDADDAAGVEERLRLFPSLIPEQDPNAGKGPETELLHHAIKAHKTNAAKALVKMVPDLLTATDANGFDLMARILRAPAPYEEVRSAVEVFADQMASARDPHGNTYLHHAASIKSKDLKVIKLVAFYYQGRLDIVNDKDETPLMQAAKTGSADSIQYLQSGGANMHKTDSGKSNATMHAIRHQNFEAATHLLQRSGKVDFADPAVASMKKTAEDNFEIDFLEELEEKEKAQTRNKQLRADFEKHQQKVIAEEIPKAVQKGTRSMKAPRQARFSKKPV